MQGRQDQNEKLCCFASEKNPVLLQAMREDPPPDARCRDKFLVQSVAITPEKDLGTVTAIVCEGLPDARGGVLTIQQWQNVEKISKGSIEERKIRVVFLPAEGTASTPQHNNINGTVRSRIILPSVRKN